MSNKTITAKECRFVSYVPQPEYEKADLHLVKEIIHYDDGTSEPHLNFLYDYKRPFWITKPGLRQHKQKKEWEKTDNLIRFESTERDLILNITRALKTPWFRGSFKDLCASPYIYGVDIMSTACVKQKYIEKYPNKKTYYSVGVIDVETDVLNGTEEIVMLTFSHKEHCITAVLKSFVKGIDNVEDKLQEATEKHIGKYIKERNIKPTLYLCDSEIEVIKVVFEKIHQIKPDFLAVWNLDFEITKFLTACEKAQEDIKYILSDPSVPDDYKYFKYKKGPTQKVTSSGKITPIKPAARWNSVITPASFYMIDSMCVYKQTRTGQPEKQSYSLDAILQEELEITKLKLPEADKYKGLEWHIFMQKERPIDYIVYNRFDCISVELLDEKIKDLAVIISQFSNTSDFQKFNSQPRRTCDNLHWTCLEQDRVIGTTGETIVDEFDEMTLSRDGWIVTLPAELIHKNGLRIIEEIDVPTTIYSHTGDLDVSASYPNGECVFNISKETTARELVDIEGVSEEVFRIQGLHLSAGHVNAIEYCSAMMGFPTLPELLKVFQENQSLKLPQSQANNLDNI